MLMQVGQFDEGRAVARQALERARAASDARAQQSALNALAALEADLAAQLRLFQQSVQAAERGGLPYARMAPLGNLADLYGNLGLQRRSMRAFEDVIEVGRRLGAHGSLAVSLCNAALLAAGFGDLGMARRRLVEFEALVRIHPHRETDIALARIRGALARAEGQPSRARAQFETMRRHTHGVAGQIGVHLAALAGLADAQLACGKPRQALRCSQQAVAGHRAHGLARLNGLGVGADLWWHHHRSLVANRRTDEAWAALQQAHALLVDSLKNVRDEGLRRSCLNKMPAHRDIVRAWLAEAALRGLPDDQRLAHLKLPSDLGEPFKRLVDTGVRLNQLRSTQELQEFLVEELLELTGAERVLLVLEGADESLTLAGGQLPSGEDTPEGRAALLRAITPWLEEARLNRALVLRHGPEGVADVDQRSCLVAPLVVQREVLGYLYADMEGIFGRFTDVDRDLSGMLAAQAAVALSNARWGQGLEAKVSERTAEARAARDAAEQRAAELAIINSIQQGLAAEPGLQRHRRAGR